jgi:hypothetical protein
MIGSQIRRRRARAARPLATAAVGLALALAAAVAAPTPAAASGKHTTKSFNGLTCKSAWYRTYGGTKCTGNPKQRWRLHVTCRMAGAHDGPWSYGPGEDGYECFIGITSASVTWG